MGDSLDKLGQKLSEATADKYKIFINVFCRMGLVLLLSFVGVGGLSEASKWFGDVKGILVFLLIFIPSLIWALYPLRYMKSKLEFYEKGFVYKGGVFLLQEVGEITFCDYVYGFKTEQYMKSDLKKFNVTYIYRPKKAFNEAYLYKNERKR